MSLIGVLISFRPMSLRCVRVRGCMFVRYFRYRFLSLVRHAHTPDMDSRSPEGYTDKQFYYPGETVTFFLRSDSERNTLVLRRMSGPFQYEDVYTASFARQSQTIPSDASEQGCAWKPSMTVTIGDEYKCGYYQAMLTCEDSDNTFEIYFIIGSREPGSIVVVASVSTWTAYNPWGGKSLYQNKFANKTVYYASIERPNTAFELNHSIHAEANIFNWFSESYPEVSIVPDYQLEEAGALDGCKLLVLSYHCEYISNKTHRAVRSVIKRGVSLISLGANQLYWVVRWNANYTIMECRKDLTFFHNTFSFGGMWKHHFRPPQKYLGGRYNGLGMHTFAPYRLIASKEHWVLAGIDVQLGELFGIAGIDGKPICGAETDKAIEQSDRLDIIAHGMNCESESIGTIYDSNDPRWNGSGGGDMTILYHSNGAAVLNTASIQSGAGLGVDAVFTGIIRNFVKRYGLEGKNA